MCSLGEAVMLAAGNSQLSSNQVIGQLKLPNPLMGEVADRILSSFKGWEGLEGTKNLKIQEEKLLLIQRLFHYAGMK